MTAVLATLSRSRRVRYAVPAVVAAVALGVGPFVDAVTAQAHGSLPPLTAAQLLADVSKAQVPGVTGTVVESSNLGLPALPDLGGAGGGNADFSSLLTGSHTMRVWYAGPDRVRVALLGRLGESDLVRHGSDLWIWSSQSNTATHATLPSGAFESGGMAAASAALTPQQAARAVLAAIGPTTQVTTDPTAEVAGRPAYQLDLVPRDGRSLVGSVRIAIDGATRVPTRVQVFARGSSTPAFQIGYTSFSAKAPSDSVFDFSPPPGAKVKQALAAHPTHSTSPRDPRASTPQVFGRGWTTVLVTTLPNSPLSSPQATSGPGAALLRSLPTVSGSWGSGKLLSTTLFTAVLTDDGRVAVGAVPPSLLYAALGRA